MEGEMEEKGRWYVGLEEEEEEVKMMGNCFTV